MAVWAAAPADRRAGASLRWPSAAAVRACTCICCCCISCCRICCPAIIRALNHERALRLQHGSELAIQTLPASAVWGVRADAENGVAAQLDGPCTVPLPEASVGALDDEIVAPVQLWHVLLDQRLAHLLKLPIWSTGSSAKSIVTFPPNGSMYVRARDMLWSSQTRSRSRAHCGVFSSQTRAVERAAEAIASKVA